MNIKYKIKSKINSQQYLLQIYKNEIEIIKKKLKNISLIFFKKKTHIEIINIIDNNILCKNIKNQNMNVINFIKYINNFYNFFDIYLEKYLQINKINENIIMLKCIVVFLKYKNIPFHIKINILKYKNIHNKYQNIYNQIKKIKYQLLRI